MRFWFVFLAVWGAVAFGGGGQSMAVAEGGDRVRLVVLTDIGGDPDDQQSMVRLLCYANAFTIEGLMATSRMGHGRDVKPELIRELVDAYGEVRENLLRHAPGFPAAEHLRERIKAGQPEAGSFGAGKDTPASEAILAVVDAPDPRPVWFTVWGGATDLAQALWKVRHTRGADRAAAFARKMRVYAIGDQDGTGAWIQGQFPGLFYIESRGVPGARYSGVFRGMYQNESGGAPLVRDPSLVTQAWVKAHVREGHGPLGAKYPLDAVQTPTATRGLKEGDTPSWFYLLPNGLGNPDEPAWGGWGGRFTGAGARYRDGEDEHPGGSDDPALRQKWTVARWREAYQNDFAARMDWNVKPYDGANHAPVARVAGGLRREVRAGEAVILSAAGSADPDGDALSYRWHFYREAGSYRGELTIRDAGGREAGFVAPDVPSAGTVHVLLTVTDDGAPALSAYRRIVFTVKPGTP